MSSEESLFRDQGQVGNTDQQKNKTTVSDSGSPQQLDNLQRASNDTGIRSHVCLFLFVPNPVPLHIEPATCTLTKLTGSGDDKTWLAKNDLLLRTTKMKERKCKPSRLEYIHYFI